MYTTPVSTAIVLKNGQLNSAGDNLIPYPQHLYASNKVLQNRLEIEHEMVEFHLRLKFYTFQKDNEQ